MPLVVSFLRQSRKTENGKRADYVVHYFATFTILLNPPQPSPLMERK